MSTAQFCDTPRRRYYTGRDIGRAIAIADLRARTHKIMPRLVLEYLEGGAEEESTLQREAVAYQRWRFMPHTLRDVTERSCDAQILGRTASMPLCIAPTGLNGLFRRGADLELAQAAAKCGVPYIQSTMSNVAMERIAAVPGIRHWWQLYMFGGEEIWRTLVDRAQAAGCEALVLTTNAQIFGRREWSDRLRLSQSVPTLSTAFDAALHPRWVLNTLMHGLPTFENVTDFIPRECNGMFQSANWIRSQMPKSLNWDVVRALRSRWHKPLLLKGLLNLDDVRRAKDSGVDGIILGSHGGRQMDDAVSALDILPAAREIVGSRMPLYMSGGIRRGTDMLKAIALGADAVLAGRAVLYGLCAYGEPGAERALTILREEAINAMGQLGIDRLAELGPDILLDMRPLPADSAAVVQAE